MSADPRAGVRIAAIVLAAGLSSRMAPRNKLLELVEGKAIVARVAEAAMASGAKPVIVVTGFDAERVAGVLRDLNVALVHNPGFDEGLSSSLRAGLSALPKESDGALVLLGDMPEIESSDITALMAAFKDRRTICVPVRDGKVGNPVLFGASYFAEMMQIRGDAGAKQLLSRHEERVREVEVGSNGIFADVDTPADLTFLRTKIETKSN